MPNVARVRHKHGIIKSIECCWSTAISLQAAADDGQHTDVNDGQHTDINDGQHTGVNDFPEKVISSSRSTATDRDRF